ncbi:MAG TPA: hypothetical protein PKC03_07810 [Dokdonella sp.]|nr:hypothetical protein [Dokdonella sp.]
MSTPDSNQKDQGWVPRSRELLDHHAERLDPISARQLSQARQRALASVRRPPLLRWAFGLGAATATSLLVFAWLNRTPGQPGAPLAGIATPAPVATTPVTPVTATTATTAITPTTAITQALTLPDDELELIANPDDYALLQDLEFYAWLESAEHGG